MSHQGGARQEGREDAAAVDQLQSAKKKECHQNVFLKGNNMGHKGGACQEGGEDTAAVHQQQNAKQKNVIKMCS